MTDTIHLSHVEACNFPHGTEEVTAHYDGKTYLGPWAWMCEQHFQEYGVGLGIGKGQRIVYDD